MRRRQILAAGLAGAASTAWGGEHPLNSSPIKVGVETALVDSGFAEHMRRAMGRDLGLVLDMRPACGLDILDQLRAGTLEAGLTQVVAREEEMEKSGRLHTRKLVVVGSYVLVGPASDPAGIKGSGDVLKALDKLVAAGQADPNAVAYVLHGEPSGSRETEQGLWKALGPRPVGTWMKTAPPKGPRAAHDMAAKLPNAYALVERGVWTKTHSPLKVLLEGDPRMDAPYHTGLPFATRHPAGKLLAGWMTTATGQQAVKAFSRDYRLPGS